VSNPVIGQVKMVALVKALRAELGEECAETLVPTRTQTIMQGASHCDFRYRCR
jgi:hypothetical protein